MGLEFVREGEEGHGNLTFEDGANKGWIVVDIDPNKNDGEERAMCRCGEDPKSFDDVDFFQQRDHMMKLVSGDVTVSDGGFTNSPRRVYRLIFFSIPSVFPAENPPLLYTIRPNQDGGQTPLEYLQSLKETEPTCKDLPLPLD